MITTPIFAGFSQPTGDFLACLSVAITLAVLTLYSIEKTDRIEWYWFLSIYIVILTALGIVGWPLTGQPARILQGHAVVFTYLYLAVAVVSIFGKRSILWCIFLLIVLTIVFLSIVRNFLLTP